MTGNDNDEFAGVEGSELAADELGERFDAIESKVDRVLGKHLDPPYEERDLRGKLEYWAEYEEMPGEGLTIQRHMLVIQAWAGSLGLLAYVTGVAPSRLVWEGVAWVVLVSSVVYAAAVNVQRIAKACLWVMGRV